MGFVKSCLLSESTLSPTSGSGGQNWITDPSTFNAANFSEGIDFMDFDVIKAQFLRQVQIKMTPFPGGRAFSSKFAKWQPGYVLVARMDSETQAEYWDRFIHQHSEAGANTLYLVLKKRGGSDFWKRWNPVSQATVKYLPGELMDAPMDLAGNKYQFAVNVVFQGKWS